MKRLPYGGIGRRERGTTMVEILVSIIIVVLGLLGLAGLQSRAAVSEMEAFQRAQAIVLAQDMADRISANRRAAETDLYVTPTPLGTGTPAALCGALNGVERDHCEWNRALLGAAEEAPGGVKVGAMIGARGCVQNLGTTMPRQYLVSVVWQGLVATKEPGATLCGQGEYGDEKTRRAITTVVSIGCLQNDPATGLCVGP